VISHDGLPLLHRLKRFIASSSLVAEHPTIVAQMLNANLLHQPTALGRRLWSWDAIMMGVLCLRPQFHEMRDWGRFFMVLVGVITSNKCTIWKVICNIYFFLSSLVTKNFTLTIMFFFWYNTINFTLTIILLPSHELY
jgi:hypothetical protein